MVQSNITDIFDSNGNFQHGFDPMRPNDKTQWMFEYLFEETWGDVYLRCDIESKIKSFVDDNKLSPWCDAVALIHAEIFSISTKGNYNVTYYWR